jgi:ABC-type multidrug transport system fused ATPase/permease subunit
MQETAIPVVKRTLFSWIFSDNIKYQVLLLVVILIAVFARVVPLEMQKRIIDEAIFLRKIDLLFIYCGIYLGAVVTASGLKYLTNVLETVISQRATANMRKALYHHILTLPLNFFRNTQPGMVVNALITELTIPGNFIGMAVSMPASNVLTLLAFAGYLFYLNPLLAALSLSIYPLVLFMIPLLQKQVNRANKKRISVSRDLSSRVAESISGIHEIQGNGAFTLENNKFNRIVDKLLKIRIVWSLYRFAIKTTNNFFTSLGPFLVFILGGWLTIKGQLELGALVAFLSAQEKLYNPWKELIEFYQVYQDGAVNYKRTMQYFDIEPEYLLEPADRQAFTLENKIETKNLSFVTDDGIRLLDNISMTLDPGEHMALVGFSGSGKSTLALCIGQLYKYSEGHAFIGDHEVAELTRKDMITNLGFVSQSPFIFDGTIRDNLLYSYMATISGNDHETKEKAKSVDAGSADSLPEPTLDDMISVLQQTGIFVDVLRFGLNTIVAMDQDKELTDTVIRIREKFKLDYGEELAEWVEFLNEEKYLYYSSIADNIIFGTPNNEEYTGNNLASNHEFIKFLDEADLTRPLYTLGAELSTQTVDILKNLPAEEVFYEQSPIKAFELDRYIELVDRLRKKKFHQLKNSERTLLLDLGLRFSPGKHKMATLPKLLEKLILEGRSLFRDKIIKQSPNTITFYQMDRYIHSQTILNNILFGHTKTRNPRAQEKINQSIIQLLIEEDLLEQMISIGMDFEVGSKGDRLSGGQRQKLAIARAFLKNPRILIMDEATSALDNKSQARIQNIIERRWKGKSTLIAVVHRLDIVKGYDKVGVMKAGKIVEMGTYDELIAKKGILYELEFGKT